MERRTILHIIFLKRTIEIKQQFHFIQNLNDVSSSDQSLRQNILEGRDKLTKFLIYTFKLIDATKSWWRTTPTYRFERIGSHFQRARQVMRFGKFITEYEEVIKLISDVPKDQFGRLIRIICHSLFAFFWVLDNASVLCSFNLLNYPQYKVYQSSMTIKVIALSLAALLNLRSWLRLHHLQLKARKALKYLKGTQNLNKSKQLMNLVRQQWKMFLLCLKIYADMLPSIAKSSIAKKYLNFEISRFVQAIGGLINALVSCVLVSL